MAFTRQRRGGRIVATFSGLEADLLRSLAQQIVELLHDEAAAVSEPEDPLEALLDFSGPTTAPDDPALARLLPSAYRDDDEAAGDFRRFTEPALRSRKADTAGFVIDTLEEAGLPTEFEEGLTIDVDLDAEGAETWLRAFTDVRLALGARLDVAEGDEEFWDSLPDDDPRAAAHHIYEWVGYLQETLVAALSR